MIVCILSRHCQTQIYVMCVPSETNRELFMSSIWKMALCAPLHVTRQCGCACDNDGTALPNPVNQPNSTIIVRNACKFHTTSDRTNKPKYDHCHERKVEGKTARDAWQSGDDQPNATLSHRVCKIWWNRQYECVFNARIHHTHVSHTIGDQNVHPHVGLYKSDQNEWDLVYMKVIDPLTDAHSPTNIHM